MAQEELISAIVREVIAELNGGAKPAVSSNGAAPGGMDPVRDYPLGEKRRDLVKTPAGKSLDQITLDAVVKGDVTADELRITPEVLELQAQIAEAAGRRQTAMNLRRAAEMTRISDERILEMYNALRPYRSSKAEMLAMADELENKYAAKVCANFVREAAAVYEARGRLRQD